MLVNWFELLFLKWSTGLRCSPLHHTTKIIAGAGRENKSGSILPEMDEVARKVDRITRNATRNGRVFMRRLLQGRLLEGRKGCMRPSERSC